MTTTGKLRTGTRMSLDEFLALGETDGKWELDDGALYIMASGNPDHQFLMRWLCRPIEDYFLEFEQPPAQLIQEMTTILSRELQRAPEPDIVIILNERRHIVGPQPGLKARPTLWSKFCLRTAAATWYASGRFMLRPASWNTG